MIHSVQQPIPFPQTVTKSTSLPPTTASTEGRKQGTAPNDAVTRTTPVQEEEDVGSDEDEEEDGDDTNESEEDDTDEEVCFPSARH
jgi:hypothetical protein